MANAAEIADQLGLTPTGEGGYTGSCPSCGYETGFSVVDKDGKTLFYCHAGGCSQQDIIEALREYGLWGGQPSGFLNVLCNGVRLRATLTLPKPLGKYGSDRRRRQVPSWKHISGREVISG